MKKNMMAKTDKKEKEFEEKVIKINRVSKKTKGGNKLSFSVLMVIGDRKGRVGMGMGKAAGVPDAMRKASVNARKRLMKVPMKGNTLLREITHKRGAARIFLKPAAPGTGIIAGGTVKSILEVAGVRDVLSKVLGTMNQSANAHATLEALKEISKWHKLQQAREADRKKGKDKKDSREVDESKGIEK